MAQTTAQGITLDAPDIHKVLIYGDNKPAISLTINPTHHFRTKHMDGPYHFVREQVMQGSVTIEYLSTKDMPADRLTKPLTGMNFLHFVNLLGLQLFPTSSDVQNLGGVSI